MAHKQVPVREQSPKERIKNFDEVSFGYGPDEAVKEGSHVMTTMGMAPR